MTLPFALPALPRWAWFIIGGALLILAFYLALDAYGDSRYEAGEKAADAKWEEAERRLLKQAAQAGSEADKKAAARAVEFAAKVEEEKARLDQAAAEGSSPLDVLFGE